MEEHLTPPPPEPATTAQETELAEARAKAEENLNGWKRAAADYANLKKEIEKQREDVAKYAAAQVITSLLGALDHFAKAIDHKPVIAADGEENISQWIKGVEHVKREFDTILATAGLRLIADTNVPFDPSLHEAMMTEKREGESGSVVKILEPGYRMHDRVLRPAKVVIAE
ncbi:nucleotide exchange factor GrpE [Candidatus Uhrbacteria bacterium]|nr:nucleotide exchange factor GrpE [Candidatus Uhrbacteria bacterium]